MLEFMRAGGVPIWVVLVLGLFALGGGLRFALRPKEGGEAVLRGLGAATTFAVLSAVSANVAMVFWRVSQVPELAERPDVHLVVLVGLAEALTPAILGFTLLALTWAAIAMGRRRLLAGLS